MFSRSSRNIIKSPSSSRVASHRNEIQSSVTHLPAQQPGVWFSRRWFIPVPELKHNYSILFNCQCSSNQLDSCVCLRWMSDALPAPRRSSGMGIGRSRSRLSPSASCLRATVTEFVTTFKCKLTAWKVNEPPSVPIHAPVLRSRMTLTLLSYCTGLECKFNVGIFILIAECSRSAEEEKEEDAGWSGLVSNMHFINNLQLRNMVHN